MFLEAEVAYNTQVRDAVLLVQEVQQCLDKAEALIRERQILEALHLLDSTLIQETVER